MKKENGFTLVEVLIALFIGSFMLMAIYSAVNSSQRSSSGIERRVIAQQDARSALELMAMEIQMASYNPTLSKTIWVDTCSGSAANQKYMGIQEAKANSITIEMDINDNHVINTDTTQNPNEIINYSYDSISTIFRSTNCGTAQPFLGATAANANTRTVLVVNNTAGAGNTAIPVFRYYDGSGTELAAPVTTSIPDIRRIEITLVADTATSDPGGGRRRIVYSTSVIPRNHVPRY